MNEEQVVATILGWKIPIVVLCIVVGIPLLYGIGLRLFDKPTETDEKKISSHWNKTLWCSLFVIYGILFAFPATCYFALYPHENYRVGVAIVLYLLPLFYIIPSIKVYNLTNRGLLLLVGYDVCLLRKGIWFIPYFLCKTIIFTSSLQEYQFPDDSAGEEHDKTISISTGEHAAIKTDKADGSVKMSYVKAGEEDEADVLSQIIMLDVSPMVVFTFENARDLFQNFNEIYFEKGDAGVSEEIARQIRDIIVGVATELFPTYTAKEIFEKLKTDINGEILTRVKEAVSGFGIKLKVAKLLTVNYDKKIKEFLDTVVQKNTEAIGHLMETKKDVKAYELWTAIKSERAKILNEEGGDKLALILQLEAAVEIAKNSTNYNIGGGSGTALFDVLSKVASGIGLMKKD